MRTAKLIPGTLLVAFFALLYFSYGAVAADSWASRFTTGRVIAVHAPAGCTKDKPCDLIVDVAALSKDKDAEGNPAAVEKWQLSVRVTDLDIAGAIAKGCKLDGNAREGLMDGLNLKRCPEEKKPEAKKTPPPKKPGGPQTMVDSPGGVQAGGDVVNGKVEK